MNNQFGEANNQLEKEHKKKNIKIAITIIAIVVIIVILVAINNANNKPQYNSAEEYANLYESCHSTYEHINAIYSYDLNNDNYLSESELQLFFNAHPRLVNDKQFLEWVESKKG